MDNTPIYQGKPTAYLDHNILDFLTKYKSDELLETLLGNYQVVYSDETLKEIKRSTGYENNFLDLLNELKAFHLSIVVDDKFQVLNQAVVKQIGSYEIYQKFIENEEEVYEKLYNSMLLDEQRLYGGVKDFSAADIVNEQILAYEQLHSFMCRHLEELQINTPIIVRALLKKSNEMKEQFIAESNKKYELLSEIDSFSLNEERGVLAYREHLGVEPKILNNIKSPNILEKIHRLVQEQIVVEKRVSLDKFFCLDRHPIDENADYFDYQKINVVYSMLNMLGYYPDSKIHKERRFIASISDRGHAGIASYADTLFSEDIDFVKKVEAIYEYLQIKTKVVLVKINRG